jgi:hypothetical protein
MCKSAIEVGVGILRVEFDCLIEVGDSRERTDKLLSMIDLFHDHVLGVLIPRWEEQFRFPLFADPKPTVLLIFPVNKLTLCFLPKSNQFPPT